jgi:hypothetical protein
VVRWRGHRSTRRRPSPSYPVNGKEDSAHNSKCGRYSCHLLSHSTRHRIFIVRLEHFVQRLQYGLTVIDLTEWTCRRPRLARNYTLQCLISSRFIENSDGQSSESYISRPHCGFKGGLENLSDKVFDSSDEVTLVDKWAQLLLSTGRLDGLRNGSSSKSLAYSFTTYCMSHLLSLPISEFLGCLCLGDCVHENTQHATFAEKRNIRRCRTRSTSGRVYQQSSHLADYGYFRCRGGWNWQWQTRIVYSRCPNVLWILRTQKQTLNCRCTFLEFGTSKTSWFDQGGVPCPGSPGLLSQVFIITYPISTIDLNIRVIMETLHHHPPSIRSLYIMPLVSNILEVLRCYGVNKLFRTAKFLTALPNSSPIRHNSVPNFG